MIAYREVDEKLSAKRKYKNRDLLVGNLISGLSGLFAGFVLGIGVNVGEKYLLKDKLPNYTPFIYSAITTLGFSIANLIKSSEFLRIRSNRRGESKLKVIVEDSPGMFLGSFLGYTAGYYLSSML